MLASLRCSVRSKIPRPSGHVQSILPQAPQRCLSYEKIRPAPDGHIDKQRLDRIMEKLEIGSLDPWKSKMMFDRVALSSKEEFLQGATIAIHQVIKMMNDHDLDGLKETLEPTFYKNVERELKQLEASDRHIRWETGDFFRAHVRAQLATITPQNVNPEDELFYHTEEGVRFAWPTPMDGDKSFHTFFGAKMIAECIVETFSKERRCMYSSKDKLPEIPWRMSVHHWCFACRNPSPISSLLGFSKPNISWSVSDIDYLMGQKRSLGL